NSGEGNGVGYRGGFGAFTGASPYPYTHPSATAAAASPGAAYDPFSGAGASGGYSGPGGSAPGPDVLPPRGVDPTPPAPTPPRPAHAGSPLKRRVHLEAIPAELPTN